MAGFGLVLSLSTLLLCSTAQDTCDIVNRMCMNGVCEFQDNQQMGCTCDPGFVPDPINPLLCNAIPPCNQIPGTPSQQCLNGMCRQQAPGLFRCVCLPGYQPGANPNICEDVDECQFFYNGCAPGACSNLPGSYFCSSCAPGFTLDQNFRCQRNFVNPHHDPNSQNTHPWAWAWLADSLWF